MWESSRFPKICLWVLAPGKLVAAQMKTTYGEVSIEVCVDPLEPAKFDARLVKFNRFMGINAPF